VPTPSKYPPELRERAVGLVLSRSRPIARIAEELGINRETLRTWVRQAQADRGQRTDLLSTDERQELKRLRKNWPSCAAPTRSTRRRAPITRESCAPRGAETIEEE
jgi:transposase